MKFEWILLLALLLATPPVHATTGETLLASHVMIQDGETVADLGMISVLRLNTETLPPAFMLQGSIADVATDYTAAGIALLDHSARSESQETRHTDYTLSGHRNGPQASLFVHPLAGGAAVVDFSAPCFDLSPSEMEQEYRPRRINPNNAGHRADLSHATRVLPCEEISMIQVTGDFLVGLWDWDATWASTLGNGRLETGYENPQAALSEGREAFIQVRDGQLNIPLSDNNVRLFLAAATINATEVLLGDIEGRVNPTPEMTFEGNDLRIAGAITLKVESWGNDQPLQTELVSTQATNPSSLQATLAPTNPLFDSSQASILLGLLAVAGITAIIVQHRRPNRALSMLWSAHELDLRLAPRTRKERRALGMQLLGIHHEMEGRRKVGARFQRQAKKHYADRMEAMLSQGESLLALGAYDEALATFFHVVEEVATPTQVVRAQVGASVAYLRRGNRADRHICREYLQEARRRDAGTVQRLLARAGDLGRDLESVRLAPLDRNPARQ